ncbi:MAG: hypothetical protein J0L87_11035 [Bacteroidetes bacterium]|nr:hypothetical protein [Bacteroidota bacterium]
MKVNKSDLVKFLSKDEQEIVLSYLNTIKPIGLNKKKNYKEKELFELFNKPEAHSLTQQELRKKLKIDRIDMLKSNLFTKVVEAITFEKHINNQKIFSRNDSIIFSLKKEMLAIRILYRNITKNKSEPLFAWLENLIHKAIEHEVYDVVIEALLLKKYSISLRKGIKEFDKINSKIEHFRYCNTALYNATDDYTKLILNNEFQEHYSLEEIKTLLKSAIIRLEKDYKSTGSEQINYYLQILLLANYEKEKKYRNAIAQCKKIIALLKKNSIIFRQERVGFVLDHMSQFQVYISEYSKAAISALKAQSYYLENSFFTLVSKEQEFYAHFYDGNLIKANICTNILLNHPLADTGEFRKAKFIYYKACILFEEKEYATAWKILKNNLEIEKDKNRWNISLRILCIQLFIELKKLDEATRGIEALRKHISRQSKNNTIRERDHIILNCLKELEKNGYNFNAKNFRLKILLKELTGERKKNHWEHYSHELVKFHTWLESKLIKKTPGNA